MLKNCMIILCAIPALLMGCAEEDHLRHYTSGGSYVTLPPDFSADRKTVVFSSPVTGNGDIYEYAFETHSTRLLVSSPQMDTSPRLTPQRELFYERKSAGVSIIECRNLSTGVTVPISGPRNFDELQSIAPDGKQIIASRCKRTGGMGKLANWVVIDVSQKQHPAFQLGTASASFSPDGKWIIACRYDNQAQTNIELLDRQCTVQRSFGRGDFVGFTITGKLAIVRDAANREVELTELNGTVTQKFAIQAPIEFSPWFQPQFGESSITFIAKYANRRELWSKSYSDGREQKLCQLPDHTHSWRPAEEAALLVTLSGSDPRVGSLWHVEFAPPKVELLLDLAAPKISSQE